MKTEKNISGFLLDPRMRILRHLFLQLVILLITVNVFWDTPDTFIFTTDRVYSWIGYFAIMNAVIYLNIFVLVPRYLLTGRWRNYLLAVAGCILGGFGALAVLQSLFYDQSQPVIASSPITMLVNTLSSILAVGLVIAGTSAILLFRHWVIYNRRATELQTLTLRSELDYLKNQINPHFLFNMLNNVNILAGDDRETAARILEKLEEILRYQIDDSRRDTVLLNDDIRFLTRYLELEKTRRDDFTYHIRTEGDSQNTQVPPLLFIPFVENAVKHSAGHSGGSAIDICFRIRNEEIRFTCKNSKPSAPVKKEQGGLGLVNIHRRLELLYGNRFTCETHETTESYEVHLTLRQKKDHITSRSSGRVATN